MIEPPLETRVDIGFAQLMTLLARAHFKRTDDREYTLEDFLPFWAREQKGDGKDEEKGGMSPEHVQGVMQRLMARQKLVAEQRGELAG